MILYYVHDPMCSWCWGFKPVWTEICTKLADDIEIRYVLGGLAPDSKAVMPETMQKEIAGYWKKIQSHIPGTEFNFEFWEQCDPRRSTYPACRAVIAAKKQKKDIERSMIDAIQTAYYLNAKNPSNDDVLITLAGSLGLDTNVFAKDLNSPNTQQALDNEMLQGKIIGANGFPSMIIEKKGETSTVPLDYNSSESALNFINRIKNNKN